jgi:CRISPR system Cascade subunit CasC
MKPNLKLEIHILQNVAAANLNRDDTGAPKSEIFGGFDRARLSQQALNRAVRDYMAACGAFALADLGARTGRLVEQVAEVLVAQHQRSREEALAKVTALIVAAGLGVKTEKEHKTQYLLFVPRRVITELATLAHEQWGEIASVVPRDDGEVSKKAKAKKGEEKENGAVKPAAPEPVSPNLAKRVTAILINATRSPDVALFGRMVADAAAWGITGACQTAHAFSTNQLEPQFDYYTTQDDFNQSDGGAGHLGTGQFNSSCFYRYCSLDVVQLAQNLGETGTGPLTRKTVEAFLNGVIKTLPKGKNHAFGTPPPPNYVLCVVREEGAPLSLANAFLRPVRPQPTGDRDLVDESISLLERHLRDVVQMYGARGVTTAVVCAEGRRELMGTVEGLPQYERAASLELLVARVLRALGEP